MAAPSDLLPALHTAWGINRHSVVEVVTERRDNLGLHKQLQADVAAAVHAAAELLLAPLPAAGSRCSGSGRQQQLSLPLLPPVVLQPPLHIAAAAVSSYSLALARPLTSIDQQGPASAAAAGACSDPSRRHGFYLTVTLTQDEAAAAAGSDVLTFFDAHDDSSGAASQDMSGQQQQQVFRGIGEAAPLPGLHSESPEQALQQLQLLAQLLQGSPVPRTLALLSASGFSNWLQHVAGLNPHVLYPSVRFALESALLQGLAASHGCTLAELLQMQQRGRAAGSSNSSSRGPAASAAVAVNGLLPGTGSVEELVAAGRQLLAQGVSVIKVKVGRR